MNITETTITPTQLLTAAREGKITASIIDAETLPPLAGDGHEQYPTCTIALCLHYGPDIDPTKLREIRAWKYVYYSTNGDTLNSGRGTYDFREVSSDGGTRGDVTVTLAGGTAAALTGSPMASYRAIFGTDAESEDAAMDALTALGERPDKIEIATGEGMSSVESIDITGLTEDEAEEVREAIESAIEEAYSEWSPEHPEDSEIYQALVSKKRHTTTIAAEVAGEEIQVKIYAATHCGKPVFAVAGDEDETVCETAEEAAEKAKSFAQQLISDMIQAVEAKGEEEDYGTGLDADEHTEALDKQEREAAEALEASLRDDE